VVEISASLSDATRGWKICAVGKKGIAVHVAGKFVLSEKKELQNT